MIVNQDFIELLHLSRQSMTVQGVFFHTWKGLVNHCFEDSRLNRVISHCTVINLSSCFLLSRSILCFHTFLVIRFNANNSPIIAVRACFEKNFLLIFQILIDSSRQGQCIKKNRIIIACIELTVGLEGNREVVHRACCWSRYTLTCIPDIIVWRFVFPEPSISIVSNKNIILGIFEFQKDTKARFACFRIFSESEVNSRISIGIHCHSLFFKQGRLVSIVILSR
ncbi:hypothetical protein SORDD24_00907 [Streptococcus oralis]|uniref:Uncharacterized protein n=1 Tax=Streptococcus oralis TaxID=1303 RepID=A0A139QRG8_STROR|nr:hypothetical protein SORDD24_00907 [Streptococcus oralis]